MAEQKNPDLHGNAPDRSNVALLLIDVVNDLEFEGGARLLEPALKAARHIAGLVVRARSEKIPVIYANDNFGRWRSDFQEVIDHCLNDGVRGEPVVRHLLPDPSDYFVLKPKHSAFFSTTLATLLKYLGAQTLILAGITSESCVLITAADAHMRDFNVFAPGDCTAAITEDGNRQALDYMQRVLSVDISPSTELDLERLRSVGKDEI